MPDFRTFFPKSSHGSEPINVKTLGAVGNGLKDDSGPLQKAFDLAFGPKENPHGYANRHKNRPVYFPQGNYSIYKTLYLTGVHGGKIYSDSTEGVSITMPKDTPMIGTYWRPSETAPKMTPMICMNCCSYMTIENINIAVAGNYWSGGTYVPFADSHTVLDICKIGNYGPSTMFQFFLCNMSGGKRCVRIGYMDDGVGNNCGVFYNCGFGNSEIAGIITESPSAVNWSLICGGINGVCTKESVPQGTYINGGDHVGLYEGGYVAKQGQIALIFAFSSGYNNWDVINAGGNGMCVQSGSSESSQCLSTINNSAISVGAFPGRMGRPIHNFIDAHEGGVIHCYASGSGNPCDLGTAIGSRANVGNTGMIVVDILQLGDFNSGGELSHKGTGPLWLRGHRPGIYGGSYSNLEEFTGQLVQYVPSWYQKPCLSLADVPAHMKYRSIELVIGDLQATTPGAVASGGGGLKGLCYCTGSQWRVIGPA